MAYVIRAARGHRQLLVFEHRDVPDAGVQVPAGTVEPGEAIDAALFRELEEEAGLRPNQVRLVTKVAEHAEPEAGQLRHVYELRPAVDLPDEWSHTVHGQGGDAGMVFRYYWVDLTPQVRLAGSQERFLRQ